MNWEKKQLLLDEGAIVTGIAPKIISASRSTDIPAFYSKWFFNRLYKGYISWTNPFNQKTQYVILNETRFIVFWTKNPQPIIPYLEILDQKRIGYYFQITLNDYEDENLEPNVPSLNQRIDTFRSLSRKIGKHKTIWRFDPLILSDNLTIYDLLRKIEKIGNLINSYTEKLVFSFADINIYKKVIHNLKKKPYIYREFSKNEIVEFSTHLNSLNSKWHLNLASCCEDINLERFNILHNKCIDDNLIFKISYHDKKLLEWLGHGSFSGTLFDSNYLSNEKLKDKGQRKACGCIVSKDIGMYNTCNHLCAYCYANTSPEVVKKNLLKHHDNSQSII